MNLKDVLVFDMDSVLADVGDSYLTAISVTVHHFTGQEVSQERIAEYKRAGNWNSDWALAQKLILDTAKMDVPYDQVVEVFQSHFLGSDNDGLIARERWIPDEGLLPRLSARYALAIFTGRPRAEVDITLARFVPNLPWASIVADGETLPKPAPDGLRSIAAAHPERALVYVGDNVDDARSARAAGVRFIGIAAGDEQLAEILTIQGAVAVLRSVNELESVL